MASSQSSFDEVSTPTELPSTPQPVDVSLLASQDIPRALSPTTSMAVGEESQINDRIGSPAAISSSMTPPPSSQARDPRLNIDSRRNPTASAALSSPPPTVTNGIKRDVGNGSATHRPTMEQLNNATEAELRIMTKAMLVENERLELIASEGRMSAAHYKLQYNLLSIETEEAAKRMEVEHDMTRREVEVLQYANQGRDFTPAGQDYVARLKALGQELEQDNIALSKRLRKAMKLIEKRDDDLMIAREENGRLLQRIRENRDHLNILRSPGGIFHIATPKPASQSYPATPQQYRGTPKHTPMTGRSIRREHSQEPFAALLLADRVLSQENNSAPSTPILNRRSDHPRTPVNRHNRAVQSLSSLPITPGSARPNTANSTLLPSVQFTPRNGSRIEEQISVHQSRERRRKSRDSTISASDAEEIARAAMNYREESEEVQESQASQSATEMLRVDPRESFEVAASRTTTPIPSADKAALHQAKIYGAVSKPVMEKRKRVDEDYQGDYSAKKMRANVEGVGLGIGL